jgi:hypothetical protein
VTDYWTPERENFIRQSPTDYEGYVFRYGPIKRDVWRNKRNRLVGPQQGVETLDSEQGPESGPIFTSEQIAYLVSPKFTFAGYAQRFPDDARTGEAIARARRHRIGGRGREHTVDVEQEDGGYLAIQSLSTDEDWMAYIRNAENTAAEAHALKAIQRQTEWTAPPGNLPVGIVFTGDWHLGSAGVDSAALDSSLATIRKTPGLYAVGMGDYEEGVTVYEKARSSLYTGAYNNPEAQKMAVRLRAKQLRGRWLAWLEGNHDGMRARHTGEAPFPQTLARELGCPHFGEGGGTIYAHVGSQRYAIGVRHHFGSKAASVPRRMMDEWPEWERLHVAVLGHLHFNEVQRVSRNGGRCWGLRCGTFKINDEYADRNGFRPELGTPMVILLPDVERVLAFAGDDFDLGVESLATLRDQYKYRWRG